MPAASRQTATILAIRYSPAVIIAAMAACSAQKPVPDPVSRAYVGNLVAGRPVTRQIQR